MKKKQLVIAGLLSVLLPLFLPAQSGMKQYSNEEYKLQFSYPSAWTVVEDSDGIFVLSSAHLRDQLGADFPELDSGDVILNVAVLPMIMFQFMGIEADSVEGQVEAMFDQMVEEGLGEAENVSQETATTDSGTPVSSVAFDAVEEGGTGMQSMSGIFLGTANEEKGIFGFGMALGERPTLDRERAALVDTIGSLLFTGTQEDLLGGN
ncbi:MAG: hypothetical protein ACLFPW_03670 [Spirochaetaceae bacterium]